MSNHESVTVTHIPDCDICQDAGGITEAYADAQLPGVGSWAYVCLSHYRSYGCTLGLGHGQELILDTTVGETPTGKGTA